MVDSQFAVETEQRVSNEVWVRVIVVNYNGGRDLARCAAALSAQTMKDFEVVIADNGSSDGSIANLPVLDNRFEIVEFGQNLGFAAANNQAAKGAASPWIATLNPDAFPDAEWLANLKVAVDRFNDVAMFGSTQISDRDPSRYDGTGDALWFAGIPWRGDHGRRRGILSDYAETFSPCAAAALWRRDRFEAAGGFDERFFCYCEDVDLGFRLRLAGESCIQVADAVVHHVGAGLSGRRSAFTLYHGARNRVWTMIKNMPLPLLILAVPIHLAVTLIYPLRLLVSGSSLSVVSAHYRGVVDALRGIRPFIAARRSILASRRASWTSILRSLSWSPTRLLRRTADLRPI